MNQPAPSTVEPDDAPRPGRPVRVPDTLFVIDTTAVAGKGPRVHEMIVDGVVKSFTFEPGKPLELALPIAIKFLKHEAFRRTDEHGDLQPYHRRPAQPDELGAGEQFKLADHQTIANYGELSNMALLQRCLELPGGELIDKTDRKAVIDFITKTEVARREANKAKTGDVGRDDFVPVPEVEDELTAS